MTQSQTIPPEWADLARKAAAFDKLATIRQDLYRALFEVRDGNRTNAEQAVERALRTVRDILNAGGVR